MGVNNWCRLCPWRIWSIFWFLRRKGKIGMKLSILKAFLLFSVAVLVLQSGCAVPQKRGKGLCTHQVEPETRTGYWLYLPEDYIKTDGKHPDRGGWPMVVTFHGLKPYDNAGPQIREWQQEADRFGFIVIAPELRTCDSLTMQFPLRDPRLPYVQKDERAILAIMDEVCRLTNADPAHVLSTSFSSGGYIAHYMVNRYPERFSCLAVRGSNFSEEMLNPTQVPKYRDMKVGIFFGENDFKVCRKESVRAVEWYKRRRFDVVARKVKGLGHQRTPQTAAMLFASTVGIKPKTPPKLSQMVMMDVTDDLTKHIRPRPANRRLPPQRGSRYGSGRTSPRDSSGYKPTEIIKNPKPIVPPAKRTTRKNPTQVTPKRPISRTSSTIYQSPSKPSTPKRPILQPYTMYYPPAQRSMMRKSDNFIPIRERIMPTAIPARIRLNGSKEGQVPMMVSMSVEMPPKLFEGASILWTDNNKPISTNTFNASSILRRPGKHVIQAHIITADDRQIVLSETIKVTAKPTSQPAES